MNQDKIEGLLALFPYDASIVTEEMIQEKDGDSSFNEFPSPCNNGNS